jgi:hypothetical protein
MMENARRGDQRVEVAMELEKEKWSERLALPRHDMPIYVEGRKERI